MTDLESIRDYVAKDSPTYASLIVQRIIDSVEHLSRFPQSGRIVPELGQQTIREVVVRPYRVVYRVRASAVEVVTVFHAARHFGGLPVIGPPAP